MGRHEGALAVALCNNRARAITGVCDQPFQLVKLAEDRGVWWKMLESGGRFGNDREVSGFPRKILAPGGTCWNPATDERRLWRPVQPRSKRNRDVLTLAVCCRLFGVIDDENVHRALRRFQAKPQLLLQGCDERRRNRRVR